MSALNIAIIGAGVRTTMFCKFMSDYPEIAKLTAIADINIEKAHLLNSTFKLNAHVSNDYNAILNQNKIIPNFLIDLNASLKFCIHKSPHMMMRFYTGP